MSENSVRQWSVVGCLALSVVLVAATSARAGRSQGPDNRTAGTVPAVAIDGPPPPVAPAVISRDAAGRVTVRAVKLTEPLRVDGRLDDAVYRTVPPIDGLVQAVPKEGEPVSERTEAWVLFDRDTIYVAGRCWETAPEARWVATELRRDTFRLRDNDTFGVLFDTFYDKRNGFSFYTNPLGAVSDFAMTDEGTINKEWNPIWEVRTGRFEGGWSVELAIPFKSLRYRPGPSAVWGIQFRRTIRRKNEWAHLTRIPALDNPSAGLARTSMAATLVGLEVPPLSKNLEVKPYGISRSTVDRSGDLAAPNRLDGDVGIDVKYGVTSNLTADFTYNTDFAQVEVDERQVNLTRFNLFFPEKREFFIEGRGIFDFALIPGIAGSTSSGGNTPILFFSRRIGLQANRAVPIEAGGRLTGKVGKVGIGVLHVQAGEEPAAGAQPTNFTVVRLKRDILRRSMIGVLFTNRSVSPRGAGASQTLGLDGTFSLLQNVYFSGYLARTKTPDLKGDDTSYQARFAYAADRYGAQFDHLLVGRQFNPEIGFLPRTDFRRTFASLRFSPRPRSIRAVRRFSWEGSLEYLLNGAGAVETRQQQGRFTTELENSDLIRFEVNSNYELLVRPFEITRGVTIPARGYSFSDALVSYHFGNQRPVSGTVSFQRGHFYSGTITAFGYTQGQITVTRHLSFEPSVSINRIELAEGRFTTRLARTRVDYAFTPRMFASGLLQYNATDRIYSSNLRLRWEYQPGSELFVVYTDERSTTGRGFPLLQNRAFVVKVNRLFRF